MNWLTQRLTLVIVPEANQAVRKWKVSVLALILLPVLLLAATSIAIMFIILFTRSTNTIDQLELSLYSSVQQYEKELAVKNEQLTTIQSDMLALLDQANATEDKLAEITELERQLKELVGIDTDKSPVQISNLLTEDGGQGGAELPLPDEPTILADTASSQFTEISDQLDDMLPQLEKTKLAIIQYKAILQITPTIWPADSRKVTSLFGTRKDPFTRRATFHSGLDIGGKRGDPIYATADGTVVASARDRIFGQYITINHGRGITTRYFHLNSRDVQVGDKVVKGQVIGGLGNTGRSTGPHLHYEVLVNGTAVNPEPYIQADREEPSNVQK